MSVRIKPTHRDGEIIIANITLRHTKPGRLRNPTLYAEFGDSIYLAKLTTIHSRVDDMRLRTFEESYFIDILFWKNKETIWQERITINDIKEFYKDWNIVDRRVLIEKNGCI